MRMYFFLSFILLMSVACSSPKKKSKAVKHYVDAWVADYGPEDKNYVATYRNYLHHIEEFYFLNGIESKFNFYLSSLNNNNQLLAHTEMNLPQRFKARYGRWPVQKSPNFIKYKSEILQEHQTRLDLDREKRLKEELGEKIFEQLRIHADTFPLKNRPYNFPL